MRKIYLVTGSQGSGKSTKCKELGCRILDLEAVRNADPLAVLEVALRGSDEDLAIDTRNDHSEGFVAMVRDYVSYTGSQFIHIDMDKA